VEVNRSVFERMSLPSGSVRRVSHEAKRVASWVRYRADADPKQRVILAGSFREAEQIRVTWDAQSDAIYLKA